MSRVIERLERELERSKARLEEIKSELFSGAQPLSKVKGLKHEATYRAKQISALESELGALKRESGLMREFEKAIEGDK